ncbi:MAG: hypothetical protein HY747_04850, partial [Elusimicrobia bacterium]|nr:hypothetical protein [Elusimicrobiota bacterium]
MVRPRTAKPSTVVADIGQTKEKDQLSQSGILTKVESETQEINGSNNGNGKEHGRCELTSRDYEILSALEVYGALSLDQLWAVFFGELSQKSLNRLFLKKFVDHRNGDGNVTYKRMMK